jgi:V/A-type H+-transporting ATPase subunit I
VTALFINHPVPMEKVRVITLKDNSEKTFQVLQQVGVLHVEEAKELKPVDRELIEQSRKEVEELLNFATSILSYIPDEKKSSIEVKNLDVIYTRPFRDVRDEIKLLYNKANALREKVSSIEAEVGKLNELKKYLEPLVVTNNIGLSDLSYNGEFLIARVFVISTETFKTIEEKLRKYIFINVSIDIDKETVCHAVGETANRKTIETMINDAGGRVLTLPEGPGTVRDYLKANDAKINELQTKMKEGSEELQRQVGEDVERVILLHEALLAESERLSVLGKAAEAKYITLIEGWVPKPNVEKLITEVRQTIPNAYVDAHDPQSGEMPPTKTENYPVVAPFTIIRDLFGTPKYAEWDPTPIVAYSFALFFGIMTADVIYALGIAAFARFVLPKFVEDVNTEGVRLFRRVLYTGAAVSGILGLLSGSWMADFFPAVLGINIPSFPPVAEAFGNPITFIILACAIGFVHVNIAHAYAFIQGIQSKNKGVIVTKVGFFAMQIFIILMVLAKVEVVAALVPLGDIFLYSVYASLGLMIYGVILQISYFGAFMWVFEITGLVGDILSYSRLAGVGMAGFYLGKAVNMLAMIFSTMIPGPIGLVIGILTAIGILIVGHAINTVLSIQGGFVHSMRLCLVEFMFKFYEGGGSKYNPFSLKTSRSLLIKQKA